MYVYFVQAKTTGWIKIGRAKNPASRIKDLQSSNGDALELLSMIPEKNYTEGFLHEKFKHLRVRGEWFEPREELIQFIAECKSQPQSQSTVVAPVGRRVRTPGDIGSLIRGYRTQQGLKQKELADKIDVSRQWLVDVERGHSRAEIGLVFQTLNALNIPLGIVEDKPADIDIDAVVERAKRKH